MPGPASVRLPTSRCIFTAGFSLRNSMIVSRPSFSGITRSVITRSLGWRRRRPRATVAVRRVLDLVPRRRQGLSHDLPDRIVVFDEQDGGHVRSANRRSDAVCVADVGDDFRDR